MTPASLYCLHTGDGVWGQLRREGSSPLQFTPPAMKEREGSPNVCPLIAIAPEGGETTVTGFMVYK